MIRKFMCYYQPYKMLLAGVITGTFTIAGLDLIFPVVVRSLINEILPKRDMYELIRGAVILFILYVFEFMVSYAVQYYGHIMSGSIEHDMRNELFSHLETLSFDFFDNEKTGQLLSRITSDVTEVSELAFRGPNDVLLCGVIMMGTIVAMFLMNWPLAILIGGLLVGKTIHTVKINRKMKDAFQKNRVKAGEISARAEESLSGIRLVKAFAMETFELKRFCDKSKELRNARFNSYKLLAYFSGSINFFTNFINVMVLLAGGYMISIEALTLPDFVAFLLYVNIFMRPVFRLTILAELYQRGMAGFTRFEEILNTKATIDDCENPIHVERIDGTISFRDVSFGYDNERMVLKRLNFDIPKGKMVAFVGETGAGKSTIVNLLLRFYDPTEGKILLDGMDLKEYWQQDLRKQIGIVQQDVFLFGDSIAENIGYGKEGATIEEIQHAARSAAAEEFILQLPHGYNTKVGERGVKLSGGQKQRIAIARVFLRNPAIVIFDEATSSLDTQTEGKIQNTLSNLAKDRTMIIIAHRLSTVCNADQIMVMDRGGIIEKGTHTELLDKKGKYFDLYNAQKKNGKDILSKK